MLQKEIVTKVLDFVRSEPKTIQDIALLLDKNWRTADRYVEQIAQETGMIGTKIFRKGSRGALKLVYWNALEPGKGSAYQERLLQTIMTRKRKEDFSPLDIFQFVSGDARDVGHGETDFAGLVKKAEQQVLFFSGNLSWVDTASNKALQALAQKHISLKILTRVDLVSKQRVKTLLAMNHRYGRDVVDIRHCEQPLRGMIVDNLVLSMKETLSPQQHRELKETVYLSYLIKDKEWILWMQRVFWQLWNQSIDAHTRVTALEEIRGK